MHSGSGPAGASARARRRGARRPAPAWANLQDHLKLCPAELHHTITRSQHLALLARRPDRPALAGDANRARRDQSLRDLRLSSARAPACPTPTCRCTFLPPRSATTARSPPRRTGFQVHIGPMRSAVARHGPAGVADAARPRDPLQLHERGGGLARFPHRHPPHSRGVQAAGAARNSAATRSRPGDARSPTRNSTISSRECRKRLPSPAAPAGWARGRPSVGGRPACRVSGRRSAGRRLSFPGDHQRQTERPSILVGEKAADTSSAAAAAGSNLSRGSIHWQTAQR
jgi:hypothetical protein